MLTTIPKLGDLVFVTQTQNCHPSSVLGWKPIEKVGRQYLTVMSKKFGFDGRNAAFELWDSQEAYERYLQRDRNIIKIKQAVNVWNFGNGLSDEALEQILDLLAYRQNHPCP